MNKFITRFIEPNSGIIQKKKIDLETTMDMTITYRTKTWEPSGGFVPFERIIRLVVVKFTMNL